MRETDNTPPFKVNRILNSWYDFGLEKGCSVIDLASFMFNDNVSQELKRLSSDFGSYTPIKYHQPIKKQFKTESALVLGKVCSGNFWRICENIIYQYLLRVFMKKCAILTMDNIDGHGHYDHLLVGCLVHVGNFQLGCFVCVH